MRRPRGFNLSDWALKHRSFWLGVLLHFSIAFLMDMFSLIRGGHLPTHW